MKKLAIFVEGKTERVFVEKLLRQFIEEPRLSISVYSASGGRGPRSPRVLKLVSRTPATPAHEFHVQIVESQNDERVGSDIRDRYEALVDAGFSAVIGIRDVFDEFAFAGIPALRTKLRFRIKTSPINPVFILGVMEVEAWFLAEHTHFGRIHPALDCPRILAAFGFDPSAHDMQTRSVPHEDLHAIYWLEGIEYRKRGAHIELTTDALDYTRICCDVADAFPDLKRLLEAFNDFFLSPASPPLTSPAP